MCKYAYISTNAQDLAFIHNPYTLPSTKLFTQKKSAVAAARRIPNLVNFLKNDYCARSRLCNDLLHLTLTVKAGYQSRKEADNGITD